MSRSVRGGKPGGFEFWSKRAGGKYSYSRGTFAKRMTHRVERQEGKAASKKELSE